MGADHKEQADDRDCSYVDFGFLTIHRGFQTTDWSVNPLSNYTEQADWLRSQVAHDGYLYPPRYGRLNSDDELLDEPSVPCNLFKVRASHRVERIGGENFACDVTSEAFFLTQCLGLIYRQRVTFERWWLDQRVRYPSGVWGDTFYDAADDFYKLH